MEREKGNAKRPLPTRPNYEGMQLAKETRTRTTCQQQCLTARFKDHSKIVKGKGHVRTFDTIIDQNCGLYEAASNAQLPSTSGQSNIEKRRSMNICSECFKKIGKDVRHSCGAGPSSSSARENVLSVVEKLPEKQQNQEIVFPTEGLDKFQWTTGASQNQMNKMTNVIRSFAGRKSIPKNYKQHMCEKSNSLGDIYEEAICPFEAKEEVNEIPFKFSSDLKLILIINGQQTAIATYLCPYCFITLSELHTFGKLTGDADKEESMEIDVDDIILKTYKNLKDDYNKFKCFGKDKKSEYKDVVNDEEEDDINMYVLQKCVLPELHLLQGFTNHLLWNGIVPAVGREKALLWPLKLKLVAKNYQGEIFEDNACRKLLQESDKLLDPKIYEHVGPFKLQPYVAAFKTMNNIVHDCFSTQRADITDLEENLKKLRKDLESTGTSQTLKMHIILDHLKEGISLLHKDGLGLWSEQCGETLNCRPKMAESLEL
ncbi:hypothetical protein CBL_10545 [Carabus blaptoides fortunei]